MAKSKVILKKKAQEKIVPAPPQEESSSSSELNEDEAENSHPLANSTTRGTPVTGALNKTAAKNNKVFLDEEETESSEDETQGLKTNKKRQSKSEKAGLQFPVSRIHRKLKNGGYSDRTSDCKVFINFNSRFQIKQTLFYFQPVPSTWPQLWNT